MERIDNKATARCSTIIEGTPSDLRMVAARLEVAEKNCLPGQEILVPFSGSVAILYKPQLKSAAATGVVTMIDSDQKSDTILESDTPSPIVS